MKLSPIVDHDYFLNIKPNQHHAEDHKARHQKGGADDLESLLQLANFSDRSHNSLTNVTPSQHHTKTSKLSEITIDIDKDWAGKAINSPGNVDGVDISAHAANASAHHARYADAEAVAAAEAKSPFNHAGNVKLGDNIMLEGTSTYRVYRNLASYSFTGSGAGAFVVHTNLPTANQMSRMEVDAYFYDSEVPSKLIICWYTRSDLTYSSPGFVNLGTKKLDVRWAREISTGKQAIIIGAEGSSYSHPKMTITSYMMGYMSLDDSYADGWSITQETNLSGFDNIYTIPEKHVRHPVYASDVTSGTFGSGDYTFPNNVIMAASKTVDGVDISAHAANGSAHHTKYTNAEAVSAAEAANPFNHAGNVVVGGEFQSKGISGSNYVQGDRVYVRIPDLASYSYGYFGVYDAKTTSWLIQIVRPDGNASLKGNLSMATGKTVQGANCIPVASVKTSQGSTSGNVAAGAWALINMHVKSFFPGLSTPTGILHGYIMVGSQAASYTSKFAIYNDPAAPGTDYDVRWYYLS